MDSAQGSIIHTIGVSEAPEMEVPFLGSSQGFGPVYQLG